MASESGELSFAEKQLKKFGWEKGMGLGKNNHGIVEPIKVKSRMNRHGMGKDAKEKYRNWWDDVYNKIVDDISVKTKNDGTVELKRAGNCDITEDRPSHMRHALHYTNFQQQGTLVGNNVESGCVTEAKDSDDSSSSSSSSSDSETEAPATNKGRGIQELTDAELFELCGRRTGHKAARHGIRMTGKLARCEQMDKKLRQQRQQQPQPQQQQQQQQQNEKPKVELSCPLSEQELLQSSIGAQYKKQLSSKNKCEIMFRYDDEQQDTFLQDQDTTQYSDCFQNSNGLPTSSGEMILEVLSETEDIDVNCNRNSSGILKKKKKTDENKSTNDCETESIRNHSEDEIISTQDISKKKKNKHKDKNGNTIKRTKKHTDTISTKSDDDTTIEENNCLDIAKKKKKKKVKNVLEVPDFQDKNELDSPDASTRRKKKKKHIEEENTDFQENLEVKKKKKKSKHKIEREVKDSCEAIIYNSETVVECKAEEDKVVKKKSKKRKRRDSEE